MNTRLLIPGLALFLAACGGSGSGSGSGAVSGNLNLDESNVTVLTEGQTVTLTPAGGDSDSADVVGWQWSVEPINEGALGACGSVEGFDIQRAARRLQAACTNANQCAFSFDQFIDDTGATRFDLTVPLLQAPIGLTYHLEAINSDNQTASANFTFCLLSVNEAPDANDDSFTALEGSTLDISSALEVNLLSNDVDDLDVANQPLTVNPVPVVAPLRATEFTLGNDGGFSYLFVGAADIPAGQSIQDSFVYEISDGSNTATATATINVVTVDKPPLASGVIPQLSYTVGEDIEFDLSGFFTDPEGSELIFVADSATLPPSGEIVLTATGMLLGSAQVVDAGSYAVAFTVTDQVSTAVSTTAPLNASVNIEILPNSSPLTSSIPDLVVQYGQLISVDMSQYFSDAENDPLRYSINTNPATSLQINPETGLMTGTISVPNDYEVIVFATDGYNPVVAEAFILTQLPSPNRPPVLGSPIENAEVLVNEAISPIVAEFSDPDGDTLTYEINTLPPGLAFDPATAELTGTPTVVGSYQLLITASDPDGLSLQSNFFFLVVKNPPNSPPVSTVTFADQTVVVNTAISPVSAQFSDADGDVLTYSISPVLPPGYAFNASTGVLTGTPTTVLDTEFFISASDGKATVDSDTFTISVIPAPVSNKAPVAGPPIADQAITLGQPISQVSGGFSDPDNDPLTYTITPTVAGTGLTFLNGALSGTPDDTGSTVFVITASDGELQTSTQPFTISVEAAPVINTAPQAGAAPADQQITLGEQITPVAADFTDAENDPLTFTISPSPAGTGLSFVAGVLSGTPNAVGDLTFVISASDGQLQSAGSPFTISVEAAPVINTAPQAGAAPADQQITLGEQITPVVADFTDAENDPLTFTISPSPAGTGLSFVAGVLSGTPTAVGDLTFVISASDGQLQSAGSPFTISVEAEPVINTAPQAGAAPADQQITLGEQITPVVADFTDAENDPLTFTISPSPAGTGLSFVAGVLSGTPTAVGDLTFVISASDGQLQSAGSPFTISVEAAPVINTAPQAGAAPADQQITLGEQITPVVADFTDAENDPLTFTISPSPAGTGLSFVAGVLSGTPNAVGDLTFVISASDGQLQSAGSPFTISVEAAPVSNTAPVSTTVIASQTIPFGDPITPITPNFFDADGDPLVFSLDTTSTDQGLIFDDTTGSLSGTPQLIGIQEFIIIASDGEDQGATNQFVITVEDPIPPLPTEST